MNQNRHVFFDRDDCIYKFEKKSQKFLKISFHFYVKISTFLDKWKESKVRPLYKKGPRDDTSNYRPISTLPVISKLLGKHKNDSLMTYLTSHKLLHSTQPGFRANHFCEDSTALDGP